jgi:pre-rRNA-processing protein TSR3
MIYEVIIDTGEKANKCTIVPLAHREDFRLLKVGREVLGPLRSPIFLHPEGECLSQIDLSIFKSSPVQGIACIDCVWRRLDGLLKRIEGPMPTRARIPDGILTAYPRHSIFDTDPSGGLATIEAIFVAACMLGHFDLSLLSEYYFGLEFLKINQPRFLSLGFDERKLSDAIDALELARAHRKPKTSKMRRRDRAVY